MLFKKKLKIVLYSILAALIVLTLVLFLIYNFLKISSSSSEKNDIDFKIEITRDEKGIPSISVDSVNDFYFALGFMHARDRLDIIEYLRSIATGESSGFTGSDSLLIDNISKTAGFTKNAEALAENLSEDEKLALTNYVKGINHIRGKNKLSSIFRREWRLEDVLAILSMKEWTNSYLNNTELIFNILDSKYQTAKAPIKENRYLYYYSDDDHRHLYTLRRIKELIEKYISTFARGNTIFISPELSISGNDRFSTLNFEDSTEFYPGWYPLKLTIKGEKMSALTYNGLPFILAFNNGHLSLTQVNINADTQNFYLFDTETKEGAPRYKSAGSWKEFKTLRVPSFIDNQKSSNIKWITDNGPVFSDLISSVKSDTRILVIDSVHVGPEYLSLLLKLPFETDITAAKQNIIKNDSSLKCFLISDGEESYKIYSGYINQPDNGKNVFLDGSRSLKPRASKIVSVKNISGVDYAGSDLVSKSELPVSFRNFISNDFRIERFNSLLVKKNIYDIGQVTDIITDTKSVAAEKFIPVFSSILDNKLLTSSKLSRIYFSDWDLSAKSGIQSPAIFYTILGFYINEAYRDDFGKDADYNINNMHLLYPDFYDQCRGAIVNIFDRPETLNIEGREIIFDVAFLGAMRYLNRKEGPYMENWKWGNINKSKYSLPYRSSGIISRIFPIKEKPNNGGPDTIENLVQNNRLSTVSITSYQSFTNNNSFYLKMNCGYSTAFFSDFYYGDNTLDEFQNIDNSPQIFKITITKK